MPETSAGVIKRYLEDAIATERSVETQLRTFAKEGSDDEVHGAFLAHADATHSQIEQLNGQLENLGGSSSTAKDFLAHLTALAPRAEQIGHSDEERITQNLIVAYTGAHGESAMYEALQAAAEAAGDDETQQLAQTFQQQEQAAASQFWSFLRSRAKIAFNLLTIEEVNPALNPRTVKDRIVE
ncbi:MAG: DUF892 family protein [Bryobacteraceae bacterium]